MTFTEAAKNESGATHRWEWWTPIAALLVVSNCWTGIAIVLDQQNPGSLIGGSLFVAGAVAIVVGLLVRERAHSLGRALILFGAFWGLPIFWLIVPPVLSLAVWFGVLRDRR